MTPTIHNPENVPPSAVPAGWRFMWQHEVGKLPEGTPCRLRQNDIETFSEAESAGGVCDDWTYIVPADFTLPGEPVHVAPAAPPVQRKILHMSATPETDDDYSCITVLCDDGTWWRIMPDKEEAAWKHLNVPPIPQP